MTPDESVDFTYRARKESLHIRGCRFPFSFLKIYVANVHKPNPDLYIVIHGNYKYKVFYSKFMYKHSIITLQKTIL